MPVMRRKDLQTRTNLYQLESSRHSSQKHHFCVRFRTTKRRNPATAWRRNGRGDNRGPARLCL